MNVLVDTNLLLREVQPGHVQHRAAVDAGDALRLRGDVLCLVPQVLYEFWAVATRPAAVNGLGFSAAQAATELTRFKSLFQLLADSPAIFPEWERLVTSYAGFRQERARRPPGGSHGGKRTDSHSHLQCCRLCPLPRHHRRGSTGGRAAGPAHALMPNAPIRSWKPSLTSKSDAR
jgi:hypothetical protein